ncbi:MAG: PD-(D/E)XK nuclease family protein [Desulfococcaceae bacterium]
MENQQVIELIRRELPGLLRQDRALREWVIDLTRERYADKGETQSNFERVLDELRRDREENARKWDENVRKWEEESRRWKEQNRKWEEQNKKWEEQNRKWEEQNRKWEEQNKKWEANQAVINEMLADIRALSRKHDSAIGALGARWGLRTEVSFREALAGILGDSFGVEVRNETFRDEEGMVFGRPDQVELDVIVRNGLLILCEIKSSMSKSDMVIFEKKARFYEKLHGRKADRLIVISPMVDERAQRVAIELGVEVFGYAEDVSL